jgi:uncharacterized protein DUF4178
VKLYCPSCGAALEFRYDDSFVRVCGSCHSAIARTDRGIDTLGRFADLAPAGTGLSLGRAGRWQGQPFSLAGRAEYAHPAGGSWEEWFIKLADGRWGWLSHAQGEWVLSFRSAQARPMPSFEQVPPGTRLTLGAEPGVTLTAGERNVAHLTGAEGELPFLVAPGSASRFVDASDERGRFATLDYGPPGEAAEPEVYLGRIVRFEELGLSTSVSAQPVLPARAGERLACPSCGGSIALRVPERSLSVACPYCGSLLDCEGPLAVLARQGEVDPGEPALLLGAVARFDGARYTVTGRLRRQARYPEGFVEWEEYLLYSPEEGYRWLVDARGHFSFVTPLPAGAIELESSDSARYAGARFALFDRGVAEVSGVWGEFYWKVSLGESVQTADYIAPPAMLSRESSESELHWSLGVYQTPADVQRAFNLPALRDRRRDVGAHQPFVNRRWPSVGVLLAGLLLACVVARLFLAHEHQVYAGSFRLDASARSSEASTVGLAQSPSYVFFTPAFEVQPRNNVSVELDMPLANSWAYASVDLVHEETGELRSYDVELSYYSGVDGGESWSEGSPKDQHIFAAGRSGRHVLRIEVQAPGPSNQALRVAVLEDVFPLGQLGWVLALLGAPTALFLLMSYNFERARWSESDFAPRYYRSSSDD